MRPIDYDDDDLDELEFETFSANRRPHRGKQHHKAAGHKRHKANHNSQWEDDDWDSSDDYEDYDALEFDDFSGISNHY